MDTRKIARRVLARFIGAMEHSSPEELKEYLHEHPDADPKNHSVKKPGNGSGADPKAAEAESKRSDARSQDHDKHMASMKDLKKKVENGDTAAAKKFDGAYKKLYEGGESAVKSAEKLLKQYEKLGGQDSQGGAAVKLLQSAVRDWGKNKIDHLQGSSKFTGEKLQQAEQTHAYAKKIEKCIQDLHKALKGGFD
jgi:hypothetical protein